MPNVFCCVWDFFVFMYCKGEIWVNKDCSREIRCRDSLGVLSVSSAVLAPPQLHWELTITTFFSSSFFPLSYHTQQMGFVRILKCESRCQVAAFNAIFPSFSRRRNSDIYSGPCLYWQRAVVTTWRSLEKVSENNQSVYFFPLLMHSGSERFLRPTPADSGWRRR